MHVYCDGVLVLWGSIVCVCEFYEVVLCMCVWVLWGSNCLCVCEFYEGVLCMCVWVLWGSDGVYVFCDCVCVFNVNWCIVCVMLMWNTCVWVSDFCTALKCSCFFSCVLFSPYCHVNHHFLNSNFIHISSAWVPCYGYTEDLPGKVWRRKRFI